MIVYTYVQYICTNAIVFPVSTSYGRAIDDTDFRFPCSSTESTITIIYSNSVIAVHTHIFTF